MKRHWNPEIVAIGDRLITLSVAQATMLSDYLETVHGIQAPATVVVEPDPEPIIVVPTPTAFDVVLEAVEAAQRVATIRAVRASLGLGLKEARDLVEQAPRVVKERLAKDDAEKLQAQLEAAGAKVSIRPAVA